jgi:hypothetical protein
MPVLAIPFEDVLLTNLVSILTAYSAAQVVLGGSAYAFSVERDRLDSIDEDVLKTAPVVNCTVTGVQSQGPRTSDQGIVSLSIELYVANQEMLADPSKGDKRALARLYYLKEQVKAALFGMANPDFGFAIGVAGAKKWPNFTVFKPSEQTGELWGVGGTMTFDVNYEWVPTDIATPDLTIVSVTDLKDQGPDLTATRWAGLYNV